MVNNRTYISDYKIMLKSLLRKIIRKIINLPSNFTKLLQKIRYQKKVSIYSSQFAETILFTQVYRNTWRHLYPIIEELLTKRPSAGIILLTDTDDYSLIATHTLCQSSRQIKCTIFLPNFIPNLKIAFSMSPDNKLQIPGNFNLSPYIVKCVVQHGLSDKTVFSEDWEPKPVHDYDVIFLAGPVFWEGSLGAYCKKYPDFLDTTTVLEAGLCRTDSLIRYANATVLTPKKHQNKGLQPTIIYAPTCQPSGSLETFGDEILKLLVSFKGNVILRPHPLTLSLGRTWVDGSPRRRSGAEWIKVFETMEAQHPNVSFSRRIDADPDFLSSNLMISDASGAAYEFMLLNRPVVFIDTPDLFKLHGKDGIHYWGREAGDIVSDMDQLLEAIDLNLKKPNRKAAERAALREQLLYNPGHAAEATAKFIVDILDNPDIYLKRANLC